MKKTIVVTGGAGFIGSHVVDRLVKRGWRVHVVDDLSAGSRANVNPKAKLHVLDIRSPRLASLFRKLRPVAVAHLAAQIDLRRSVREPALDADINVVGGLNVLMAAVAAGTRHLVFASSAAVYGPQKKFPMPESLTGHPSSPYGIAKFVFEHYLDFARRVHGLRSAALRFANVYGPRQSAKGEAGVVAIFLDRLERGQPCVINGDGRQTRDYVYVGDVADAVAAAVSRRLDGVFNVSTGRETDVNDVFRGLCRAGGHVARPIHGSAKAGEDQRCSLSPAKIRRALGWRAKVSLEPGLKLTVAWARDRR